MDEAKYQTHNQGLTQGKSIGDNNTNIFNFNSDAQRPSTPAHVWNVPYFRNPFFTGREEILRQLHDNFKINSAAAFTQQQAINGLGGIGKTQIAIEYAHLHRNEYPYVLWVNAASRETLVEGFVTIARLLDLPVKDEQDQNIIVEVVRQWLVNHEHWLLIMDNADDLNIVYYFLPTHRTGHILLTTRAQAVSKLAQSIEVDIMDIEEGMLMLLRRAGALSLSASLDLATRKHKEQARAIVQEMGGLPLALDQAGAYIEETHCTLSAYLHTYQQRQADLLTQRGSQDKDHPESVVTTWSLSFEQVEQVSPVAADLLRCCAFLAPDAIPEELLTEGAAELGPSLQILKTDSTTFDTAIRILRRFSFLHRNQDNRTLSIHRLVQAVLFASIDEQKQYQEAKRVIKTVREDF